MLDGLRKLQYHVDDLSGIVIVQDSELLVNQAEGKRVNPQNKIEDL